MFSNLKEIDDIFPVTDQLTSVSFERKGLGRRKLMQNIEFYMVTIPSWIQKHEMEQLYIELCSYKYCKLTKESSKIQYKNDANCQSILKCLTDFWILWLKYPFWKWLKNQYLMRLGSLVEMPQQCTLMARVAASAVQRIGIPLFLVSFKIPNRRSLGNKNQTISVLYLFSNGSTCFLVSTWKKII